MIICDTHVLIFWQDNPKRLSTNAREVIEHGLSSQSLACCDISLWEISMLMKAKRLRNDIDAEQYMHDIILTMSLKVLPITAKIAVVSQQDMFIHKDPADRLIGATAIVNKVPLITADTKLQCIERLETVW